MRPRIDNLVPLSGAVVLALFLAGCGSGAQSPLTSVAPNPANMVQVRPDLCNDPGDLTVKPCRIVFSATNPGPTIVTVLEDGQNPGRVTQHNDCATAGIATIARVASNKFQVTAGATDGTCSVHFRHLDDNGRIHKGLLTVVNRL